MDSPWFTSLAAPKKPETSNTRNPPSKSCQAQFFPIFASGEVPCVFFKCFFSQFHRIAMSLWMIAVYMTAFSVGMHAACLAGHLTLMMTGASLNHAGFDLEIRFLGAKLVVSQNWSWLCLGFKAYYCILLLYIQ